jgi:hypothetical protein
MVDQQRNARRGSLPGALTVRHEPDPGNSLERPLEAVAAGAAGIAGGQELHDHIEPDYEMRHVADSGEYQFEPLVRAGTSYPTAEPVRSLTLRAIHNGQRRMGIASEVTEWR